MNEKLIQTCEEIKEELLNSEIVQNYLLNKKSVEENKDLIDLKKMIVRFKNEGREKEYQVALKKYNEHPLIKNFESSKEEVKQLLEQIKGYIS